MNLFLKSITFIAILGLNPLIVGMDDPFMCKMPLVKPGEGFALTGAKQADLDALQFAKETETKRKMAAGQSNQALSTSNKYQRELDTLDKTKKSIIIKKELAPNLYDFAEEMCKKNNMKMPGIIVNLSNDLPLSALAILEGVIFIPEQVIKEMTESMLEAAIAHEIGHIKYKHTSKRLLVSALSYCSAFRLIKFGANTMRLQHFVATALCGYLGNKLFICRSYERQADQFAFENGKAAGSIELFEFQLQKDLDVLAEDQNFFVNWNQRINEKSMPTPIKYWEKSVLGTAKIMMAVYYGTCWLDDKFLDDHPSYEDRIKAAEDYLARHK